MLNLSREYIRKRVANSSITYQRGLKFYENGTFCCSESNPAKGNYVYDVDGNYGDYTIHIQLLEDKVKSSTAHTLWLVANIRWQFSLISMTG